MANCPLYAYGTYQPPADFVRFTDRIVPIIRRRCASADCHGNQSTPAGDLYLGFGNGGTDADNAWTVYDALLLQPSQQAQNWVLVEPYDPCRSWLTHKLDGSHDCIGVFCPRGCGEAQPPGTPLSDAERGLIRDWIAQGVPLL